MTSRKRIWVKRPGASATLVHVQNDDLVDDVRDMILKKYANSLGREFDAPDVILKVLFRDQERILGPDEMITSVLETYFPKGQSINDALIIDVHQDSIIKPNIQPQRSYHERQPTEAGNEYFPPMPAPSPSQSRPHVISTAMSGQKQHMPQSTYAHSMSVIKTGYVPPLPSPGSITARKFVRDHPRTTSRQNTSSTILNTALTQTGTTQSILSIQSQTRSRAHSNASEKTSTPAKLALSASPAPPAPPAPSAPPPIPVSSNAQVTVEAAQSRRIVTPPRVASPRLSRSKKNRKNIGDCSSLRIGMLNGGVPPINVLIVEDNNINLKLLEAFMKRLKVRWQTAVNGKIAVDKWKTGGFHLVLMDIQLPVMSGLQATREIRRLERLNGIGVFSSSASSTAPQDVLDEPAGEDKLPSDALFKSPVIIVALTASSLQSDRHEALAAGCNDFLTKPVNFVWLERKVMEWGCMQALIDFDGWRKWRDFSQLNEERERAKAQEKEYEREKERNQRRKIAATTSTKILS
ncbi:two-component response regulator SSK1p [Golovinomyces cichoracearum]|uniref:Two-component response regulator SSK1p n=1 Tax=Golovinomyces cichoracearum TaxID=62708 RepID=A0A420HC87_9PEZI|nr:two-component response regulator SSK1p [Golovinomyces cichoracearum]